MDHATPVSLTKMILEARVKRLRDRRIVNWKNGDMEILDYDRLSEMAHVDPTEGMRQRPLI